MNKLFLFLLCFCMFCFTTTAQIIVEETDSSEEMEDKLVIQPDTNFYFTGNEIRRGHIDSLKKLKAYSYIHTLKAYLESQKKAAQKKSGNNDYYNRERSNSAQGNGWFNKLSRTWEFKFVLWLLALFFILVIAYFFFVRNRLFSKKSQLKKVIVQPENEPAELHNFEKAYVSAKSKNDFRTAIKFLFLHNLYLLSQKELIAYSPDKTNHDYLLELPLIFQKDFATISLAYEYIWYGQQPLDAITFEEKESIFFHFISRIQAA